MVPHNRLFLWPTFAVGHVATVRDVPSPVAGKHITLETISREPKIFRVKHFFSEEESLEMIDSALNMQGEEYRLKRSSTGAKGYNQDSFRTSENAFDTNSEVTLSDTTCLASTTSSAHLPVPSPCPSLLLHVAIRAAGRWRCA